MKRYTRKELRELVKLGVAVDITNAAPEKIPANFEKIGYSQGINGANGSLIRDIVNGGYYVILSRSSNLFRVF